MVAFIVALATVLGIVVVELASLLGRLDGFTGARATNSLCKS